MRAKKQWADAIFTADWHIREDNPPCRLDQWPETQWDKVGQIRELQWQHECPVFIAGDFFHHWKPSPFLLQRTIAELRQFKFPVGVIPGQHDLPQHSQEQYDRSGLAVLEAADVITVLKEPTLTDPWDEGKIAVTGFPWNTTPGGITPLAPIHVALVHLLVYKGEPPFPGAEKSGGTAQSLLSRMPGYDVVVTGDNHQTFTDTRGNQLLVNPGSLGRQTAAQTDHEPSVFLWYSATNTVERHALRYNKGAITREHLDGPAERDERMEAFVRRISDSYEVSLSFKDNITKFLAANVIRKPVQDLVWELMEETK